MNKKGLYFAAGLSLGAAVGSLVTYLVTRNYIWDKAESEMDAIREVYLEEIAKEAIKEDKPKKKVSDLINNNPDLSRVKEALKKNWEKPPLKATLEAELAESEHPTDSDEDEKWEDVDPEEAEAFDRAMNYEEEKRQVENDYPVIISDGEKAELGPNWNDRNWTYFTEDDEMVDEDDQIVEDFRRFVGNVLDDSGWLSDMDEDEVIVKSGEFMSVYTISKLFGAFSDTDAASQQVVLELNKPYRGEKEGS